MQVRLNPPQGLFGHKEQSFNRAIVPPESHGASRRVIPAGLIGEAQRHRSRAASEPPSAPHVTFDPPFLERGARALHRPKKRPFAPAGIRRVRTDGEYPQNRIGPPRLQDVRLREDRATTPPSQIGSLLRLYRSAGSPSAGYPCGCGLERVRPERRNQSRRSFLTLTFSRSNRCRSPRLSPGRPEWHRRGSTTRSIVRVGWVCAIEPVALKAQKGRRATGGSAIRKKTSQAVALLRKRSALINLPAVASRSPST